MGLFLPSKGNSAYGFGGYGLNSYGTIQKISKESFVSGFGHTGVFGGWDTFPKPPIASIGGYGGHFGQGSYGSKGTSVTRVTSARALDGHTIEIFFSSDIIDDENYYNPDSYTFEEILGTDVSGISVEKGRVGELGVSSVIVKHTGTTMGGYYSVTVSNLQDTSNNPILGEDGSKAYFCGLRPPTEVSAESIDGNVILTFNEGIEHGAEELSNYVWEHNYAVDVSTTSAKQTAENIIELELQGLTRTDYSLEVGRRPTIFFNEKQGSNYTFVGQGDASRVPAGVLISKEQNDDFLVHFPDEHGRILPNSAYTTEFSFDLSTPVIRPYYLTEPVMEIFVSDGVVEIGLIFKEIDGVGIIEINSGGFSAQVVSDWRRIRQDLKLIRNERYGFYALNVNGSCLLSVPVASFTGIDVHGAGVTFNFNPYYRLLHFLIEKVIFTASQTIYTTSGNFIHNTVLNIRGSSSAVQEILLTEHGPLTKGWGDATPATKQDVSVYVNGIEVEVEAVNPYEGAIQPSIPIPLMPSGQIDVKVDYKWHKSPVMQFAGLNTEGLTLNKWDRANHLHATTPSPFSKGKEHIGRFPFGVVLPFGERKQPKLISHRYIGFERDYSAVLNSPTTLMLNQDPHRVAIPELAEMVNGEIYSLDGNTLPSDVGWGVSELELSLVGDGTFLTKGLGHFYKEVDFSFPKSIVFASRFQVEEYEATGVFTNVALGIKTNNFIHLIGMLEINGMHHVGVCTNFDEPNLQESWLVGLEHTIELTSQNTFKIPTEDYPVVSSTATLRFQVFNGTQSGVYTVIEATPLSTGETLVEFSPPMPALFTEWENNPVTLNFEHLFADFNQTYRLVSNTESRELQLFIGGAVSGMAFSGHVDVPVVRTKDSFDYNEGVFSGGVFPAGYKNTTIRYSLVQFGTTPKHALVYSRGHVIAEHFTQLPEQWFVLGDYGKPEIIIDRMALKGHGEYTFNRIEPFFQKKVLSYTDFFFKVDEGHVEVRVDDGTRLILFKNLLFDETGTGQKYLVNLWNECLNGSKSFTEAGWEANDVMNQLNDKYHFAFGTVVPSPLPCDYQPPRFEAKKNIFPNGQGLSIDFHLQQVKWDGGLDGFTLLASQGDYTVLVQFGNNTIDLSSTTASIQSIPFAHIGEFHTYRLVIDPISGNLNFMIDDNLVSTLPLNVFADNSEPCIQLSTEEECLLDFLTVLQRPNATVKRTIGVWKQGDKTHIDSWELPRTDSHFLPNSSSVSLIEEMDWREMMDVRLHRDAGWGVTVYRTDLDPPPYFDGVWATETTDPSAGWINVEYDDLPPSESPVGMISFGTEVGYSVWRLFRYRMYLTAKEDWRSPQNMVLNKANVLTSDEIHNDITIEMCEVESVSNQIISLIPTDLFAERVYVVRINDTVLPSSMWQFDEQTQTIFLKEPLGFSDNQPYTGLVHTHDGFLMAGDFHIDGADQQILELRNHFTAHISYAPSRKKRTKTYLKKQNILSSVTMLNEGTPPVPRSQIADAIREIVFGSGINVVQDFLNNDPDFFLNDPSKSVQFRNPDEKYEDLEFIEKELGSDEPIEFACDDFNEIALRGSKISENVEVVKETPQQIGHIMHLSGGNYLGKSLGGKGAVLYPNANGSIQRQCHPHINVKSILRGSNEEALKETLPTPLGDGGSCEMVLTDYANLYTHLAPWGNMIALNQNSLLYGSSSVQPSGVPESGTGVTLEGGNPLAQPTTTTITVP